MKTEQFEKLPKYAKDEIMMLRSEVENFKKKFQQMFFEGNTNTFINNYQSGNVPLPRNARIVFNLDDNIEIECRIEDGKLHVHASSQIFVLPYCTNVMDINVRSY